MLNLIDSSLFTDSKNTERTTDKKNHHFVIGYIKDIIYLKSYPYMYYLVEVRESVNDIKYLNCTPSVKWGSPFNYEAFTYNTHTGQMSNEIAGLNGFYKPSTKVIVASLGDGDNAIGIILGALPHESQSKKLKASEGVAYISEFNGVEIKYTKYGEYSITFNGVPTNIKELDKSPTLGKTLPNPTYNNDIAGSYFKFSAFGSIQMGDNKNQGINIEKISGGIIIYSGDNKIVLDKNSGLVSIESTKTLIHSKESSVYNTKEFRINAFDKYTVFSPKIAIGTKENELLNEIIEMVNKLSKCTPISPSGPCAPMSNSPQWGDVETHKNNINKIKGVL